MWQRSIVCERSARGRSNAQGRIPCLRRSWAELTGLRPNTKYYYALVQDGKVADTRVDGRINSFLTLPDSSAYADPQLNPKGLFNSSMEGNTRRAIDIREGEQVDAKAFKALVKAAVERNGAASAKKALMASYGGSCPKRRARSSKRSARARICSSTAI